MDGVAQARRIQVSQQLLHQYKRVGKIEDQGILKEGVEAGDHRAVHILAQVHVAHGEQHQRQGIKNAQRREPLKSHPAEGGIIARLF